MDNSRLCVFAECLPVMHRVNGFQVLHQQDLEVLEGKRSFPMQVTNLPNAPQKESPQNSA